jgi:hypothetical protein
VRHRVVRVADADHAWGQVIDVAELPLLRLHASPALHSVNTAGFEQQLVAHRRAPVEGDEALQRKAAIDAGFRRGDGASGPGPMPRRAGAEVLLVVGAANLVFGEACQVMRA